MRHLTPVIFTFPTKTSSVDEKVGTHTAGGWLVPLTEDTIAIDLLIEPDLEGPDCPQFASWGITHLPTGQAISKGEYTWASSSGEAIRKAQRFYKASINMGINMKSEDPQVIVGPWNALSKQNKAKVWREVAGWPALT